MTRYSYGASRRDNVRMHELPTVPRKAIRYTEATRPDSAPPAPIRPSLSDASYADIQAKAIELGINGRQTREALLKAIKEAFQHDE